jgi:NAD(P)H-dependent flavin oxidoreductase YrpB (nitropropane dioxygenase family)
MQALFDAGSRDTVRSRSWTGKPCRMLRNDWTDAWENPENPAPLGMPLQFMITGEMVARHHRYPEKSQSVGFNPVGQIVGRMNKVRKARDVIYDMVQECIEATERLNGLFDLDQ